MVVPGGWAPTSGRGSLGGNVLTACVVICIALSTVQAAAKAAKAAADMEAAAAASWMGGGHITNPASSPAASQVRRREPEAWELEMELIRQRQLEKERMRAEEEYGGMATVASAHDSTVQVMELEGDPTMLDVDQNPVDADDLDELAHYNEGRDGRDPREHFRRKVSSLLLRGWPQHSLLRLPQPPPAPQSTVNFFSHRPLQLPAELVGMFGCNVGFPLPAPEDREQQPLLPTMTAAFDVGWPP